jgi:uncharacterized membrane protein
MDSPLTPQPQPSAPPPVTSPSTARVAAASAGAAWWAEGWRMFRSRIGTWFGIVLVYIVVSLLLSSVPRIGAIADWILTPVFVGGIMLGCDGLRRGEPLRLGHLFDGFKGPYFVPLLLVGVFNVVLCLFAIIIGAVTLAAGIGMSGFLSLANFPTDPWQMWRTLGLTYLGLIALALIVFAFIAMANWFAPALIVLSDSRPLAAMMASVRASLRNWLPFLVYGLIGVAILVAASIVFALSAGAIGFEVVNVIFDGVGYGSVSRSLGTLTLATVLLGAIYAALSVAVVAVIFGSQYASYRDTLALDDTPTAELPVA